MTGLYHISQGVAGFTSNGTPVMVLGSNIGIGTSAPSATLDINGNLMVSSNLTTTGAASIGTSISINGTQIINSSRALNNITSAVLTGNLTSANVLISSTSNTVFPGASISNITSKITKSNVAGSGANSAAGQILYGEDLSIENGSVTGQWWGYSGSTAPSVYGGDTSLHAGSVQLTGNNGTAFVKGYGGNVNLYPGYAYVSSSSGGNARYVEGGSIKLYKARTNGVSTDTDYDLAVVVNNVGNMGVGTSNPSYPLDVNGVARVTDMYCEGSLGVGTTNPRFDFHYVASNDSNQQVVLEQKHNGGKISLGLKNANSNTLMMMYDNSNKFYVQNKYTDPQVVFRNGLSTWSTASSPANWWSSLAWSPTSNLFAAVAATSFSNNVMTSSNGLTWTSYSVLPNSNNFTRLNGITWAGSRWLVVGGYQGSTKIITSSNSTSWSNVSSTSNLIPLAVTWSPELSRAVLVGSNEVSRLATVGYSASPFTSWTYSNLENTSNSPFCGVCWASNLSMFAAVSPSNVHTSPDGITWTSRSIPAVKTWSSIAYAPALSMFAAVATDGDSNSVMTSTDGSNWTLRTCPASNTWKSITWSPEWASFVAVANSGSTPVMSSKDGVTWVSYSAPASTWVGVVWSSNLNRFAAIANQNNPTSMITTIPVVNPTAPNVFIDGDSNYVGIGTSNPAYSLHVIGTVYATGNITANSDSRIKTDLEVVSDAMNKLTSLTGYTYRRVDLPSDTPRFAGLLAQEVKSILPEVVQEDNNGIMGIAYGNMASLFVEAIKELNNKVVALTQRVTELEAQVAAT
jgi:hypothetical protein